jgi:hypothetical protein
VDSLLACAAAAALSSCLGHGQWEHWRREGRGWGDVIQTARSTARAMPGDVGADTLERLYLAGSASLLGLQGQTHAEECI